MQVQPRLIIISIFLIMTILLSLLLFPKKNPPKTVEGLRVFYSLQDLSNPYFQSLKNGMSDRANELGLVLVVSDAQSSSEKQVQDLFSALERGYDILICSPVQPEDCIPVVKEAQKRHIPFINPNQYIPGSDANINLDDYSFGLLGGEIAGTWIREKMRGRVQVGIIGFPDMEALKKRTDGIIDGLLKQAPNAEIVARIAALTPETGMVETEKLLEQYPGIKVIAAVNDAAALGALTAVNNRDSVDRDFCIVGLDATSESIRRMKIEGSIFRGTVDINPYGTGKTVIDTAIRVYREGPIDSMIQIEMKPIYWDAREPSLES